MGCYKLEVEIKGLGYKNCCFLKGNGFLIKYIKELVKESFYLLIYDIYYYMI